MIRLVYVFIAVAIFVRIVVADEPETGDWTVHVIPFKERSFEFKTVAKGAAPEHPFILKNPFQESLTIENVTSSCTCTTVHYDEKKLVLQTYDEIPIAARFRGDLFDGHKNATLTVVLAEPHRTEIQLNVWGEIRTDLRIVPTFLDFGNVDMEKGKSLPLTLTYSGSHTNWRLVDAQCDHEFIRAEITPLPSQQFGTKVFRVNVSLDKSAPRGAINTHLILVSNDTESRREIPIPLRATVGTVIRITPSPLFMGALFPGEESPVKNVTLLGTKPFRITTIECNNPAMKIPSIDPQAPLARTYAIPLQYRNPVDGEGAPKDGVMRAEIKVITDIPDLSPTFFVTMSLRKRAAEENNDEILEP